MTENNNDNKATIKFEPAAIALSVMTDPFGREQEMIFIIPSNEKTVLVAPLASAPVPADKFLGGAQSFCAAVPEAIQLVRSGGLKKHLNTVEFERTRARFGDIANQLMLALQTASERGETQAVEEVLDLLDQTGIVQAATTLEEQRHEVEAYEVLNTKHSNALKERIKKQFETSMFDALKELIDTLPEDERRKQYEAFGQTFPADVPPHPAECEGEPVFLEPVFDADAVACDSFDHSRGDCVHFPAEPDNDGETGK